MRLLVFTMCVKILVVTSGDQIRILVTDGLLKSLVRRPKLMDKTIWQLPTAL